MSDLQTRLQTAADEAAHLGFIPGPEAAIRRGRQRRRRLVGGTASLVVLVLVARGAGHRPAGQPPDPPRPGPDLEHYSDGYLGYPDPGGREESRPP
jgi:hypothetical protein